MHFDANWTVFNETHEVLHSILGKSS